MFRDIYETNVVSTLTAEKTWCIPGCIGGLCGVIGADDYCDI